MNRLAAEGSSGCFQVERGTKQHWPDSLLPGVLGLPPVRRAVWENAGAEDPFLAGTWVMHGSLVTQSEGWLRDPEVGVSFEETARLAEAFSERVGALAEARVLAPGQWVVALWNETGAGPVGVPVRYLINQRLQPEPRLREVLALAREVLAMHPVNEVRLDLGENPANGLWCWGGGKALERVSTADGGETNSQDGFLVGRSARARGMAALRGWPVVELRAPETLDGRGPAFDLPAFVAHFRERKNCVVYVDSPRLLGNFGGPSEKVKALDLIDFVVLRPLVSLLEAFEPVQVRLLADGAVGAGSGLPVAGSRRSRSTTLLPRVTWGSGVEADSCERFSEADCADGVLGTVTARTVAEQWRLV